MSQFFLFKFLYKDRTTLFACLIFGISALLLALQPPFFFHEIRSPDTVYHAAKIAKVLDGSLFTDPFTGTLTLYPPLFHIAASGIAWFLSPDAALHILGVLTFILLSSSLIFLGYSVFQNSRQASVFALLFSLIVYAPATKYILLQGPATLSHPLIFFSMGALFFYRQTERLHWLLTSALFFGLACQMWWFNLFFALPFLLISLSGVSKKNTLLAILLFILPFSFTAFQLYLIREVLPDYHEVSQEKTRSLLDAFSTFFLRGQNDYLETLPPWKWHYDHGLNSHLKTARDSVNFAFFFLISLPAALFMFFASIFLFFKNKDRLLFYLFLGSFFFSLGLIFIGNSAHLYRVQLYSHTLLLLYIMQTIPIHRSMMALGAVFTLWHVMHNPLLIGKTDWIPQEDRELAHILEPLAENERFFFLDASYRSLVTITPFYSLVGNKDGRYYFQDPKSAKSMKDAYQNIEHRAEWKQALETFNIKYLGFNKLDSQEALLLDLYRKEGEILYENAKWVLLKL